MLAHTKHLNHDPWNHVKERLRVELGEDVFTSWFERMEFEDISEGVVRLSVVTAFVHGWVKRHYLDRLLAQWQVENRSVREVELTIRSVIRVPLPAKELPKTVVVEQKVETPFVLEISQLDPRFTFENFVIGRSNTLAHAAAKQIAAAKRDDPLMFNPLYLYGETGLGKTHLLEAIAWAAKDTEREALYFTAERLAYGFATALRTHRMPAFNQALSAVDVLIIDDLHTLQGRAVQAEFCRRLVTLISTGRQVVVSSDRPPGDLNLDDRMRSRLAGGLVIETGPFGEELRRGFLEHYIAAIRITQPAFEVPEPILAFAAKSINGNGHELGGALNRLLAYSRLTGEALTLEMAERELRDLIRPADLKRIRIEEIQRVVARRYNLSRADLLSSRRTANVVFPRQVAMYLARTLTLRSMPEIGRRFGGRDHTTVLHAIRKIEWLMGIRPQNAKNDYLMSVRDIHTIPVDEALKEQIKSLIRQLQD